MRTLVITHVFPRDADDPSAPFLLTWARALSAAGVDVGVVAPHDAGLPARHEVAGIPVRLARYAPDALETLAYRGEMHRLARTPIGPPLVGGLVTALASALRAQTRIGRPDVVHVHWWLPGAIAARLARPAAPVVCTVHGTDVALVEAQPRLARVARWALEAADRVEAVSTDLAERLERATGRAADAVNPMPLDPEWMTPTVPPPPGGDVLRILAVGRMVPEKGFAELVEAVARLDLPARLVIVGDGPERDHLADLAAHSGVDLELPGRLSPTALREAYRQTDVVAAPSYREGLGLVAAEAIVLGLPVVATDSGGVRDLLPVADLVAPGDVDGLARRLTMVAGNLGTARAHAAAHGSRVAALLSPAAAARRTLEAYAAVT